MSDAPPTRKSALKKPMTKRMRRGFGQRRLINANGRAIQQQQQVNNSDKPKRSLMFTNKAHVRRFNFRNTANQVGNVSENVDIPLVNGKNARGNPPVYSRNDPRKNPEFAEYLGTDPRELQKSIERSKITQRLGVNRPTINYVRPYENMKRKQNIKTIRRMIAQYNMGYHDPEMYNLIDEYRANYIHGNNGNNVTDDNIVTVFEQPYKKLMKINQQVAYNTAKQNAKMANTIAKGAASRKTRRNRK
jgi:hypothetical protein